MNGLFALYRYRDELSYLSVRTVVDEAIWADRDTQCAVLHDDIIRGHLFELGRRESQAPEKAGRELANDHRVTHRRVDFRGRKAKPTDGDYGQEILGARVRLR